MTPLPPGPTFNRDFVAAPPAALTEAGADEAPASFSIPDGFRLVKVETLRMLDAELRRLKEIERKEIFAPPLFLREGLMATMDQVIELHGRHPDWNAYQLAQALGCHEGYIRATKQRCDLAIPGKRRDSVAALGRACQDAGITLKDILDLGKKRGRA